MIEVRQAKLDDTQQISQLFRERVDVWQRFNAEGQVESPPYEDFPSMSVGYMVAHG